MSDLRERLVHWLRDAHAAEEQAHSLLMRTASQIEGYPAFRGGLEKHGQQSSEQADELKALLEWMGEGPSAIKSLAGQLTAFGQTLGGYVTSDEPVKALLAISSFAHMEVTGYRTLAVAAEEADQGEIAAVARKLLLQELDFAAWVDEQVPEVTRRYLSLEFAPVTGAAALPTG